ncbi:MAG: AEC family transporter [Lachnospiraceae bacterium]|nr:AEC family transporter [Lachnospiraceae bacterium]
MDTAVTLANQVFIMFLIMSIGFCLYKFRFVAERTADDMTTVLLYIVTPALILKTYQQEYSSENAKLLLVALGLASVAMVLGIIVSFLSRIGSEKKSADVEQFAACFPNNGFMGIPLIMAVAGTTGVFYSNTYLMMFQLAVWTFGVALLQRANGTKFTPRTVLKLFANPTVISVFIGLACYFLRITFPKPITTTCSYLADMNTPLAMLVAGMLIAKVNLLGSFLRLRNYYIVFLRLIVFPICLIGLFTFLPQPHDIKEYILIVTSCPTATNTILFARKFRRDVETASQIFALCTLSSIITIPLIVALFEWIA